MISRTTQQRCVLLAALVLLGGCPGLEDNDVNTGLVLHVAETHVQARPGAPDVDVGTLPSAPDMTGGYAQSSLEHHPIEDLNGRAVSIYRAYVTLDNIELVPCVSLSELLLGILVNRAYAHAGHGSEPVGGRSLDRANIIDIVTQEGFILPLGDVAIAPGRYCGVRASVVRAAGDAYGLPAYQPASLDNPTTAPEVPYMAGRMVSLRADYCAAVNGTGQCTQRVNVDIDDDGLSEPLRRTYDIDPPLELSAARPEAFIVIGIAHGEWLDGLDATTLTSDANARQTLLENIANSVHVNARGLGALPANL